MLNGQQQIIHSFSKREHSLNNIQNEIYRMRQQWKPILTATCKVHCMEYGVDTIFFLAATMYLVFFNPAIKGLALSSTCSHGGPSHTQQPLLKVIAKYQRQ
jgi:hypothetical protein